MKKVGVERESLAKLLARTKEAMTGYLRDPSSGQYRLLRPGRAGGICGEVNGKNAYGAYVGFKRFVITKDNLVAAAGDSSYSYYYLEHCASEVELRQSGVGDDARDTIDGDDTDSQEYNLEVAADNLENEEEKPADPFAD